MNYRQRQQREDFLSPTRRKRFSQDEDELLKHVVNDLHVKSWEEIAKHMPGRTARQCRDRFNNYLFKEISATNFTPEEDEIIIQKYHEFGPRWAAIARLLNKRSGNTVKNRWYKCLSKKVVANSNSNISNQGKMTKADSALRIPISNQSHFPLMNYVNTFQYSHVTNSYNVACSNYTINFIPQFRMETMDFPNFNPKPMTNVASNKIQQMPNYSLYSNNGKALHNVPKVQRGGKQMSTFSEYMKASNPPISQTDKTEPQEISSQSENGQPRKSSEAIIENGQFSLEEKTNNAADELVSEKTDLMDIEWEPFFALNPMSL